MSRRSRKEQRRRQRAVEQRDRPLVLRSFGQLVEQHRDGVRHEDEVVRMRPMRTGYFWLWRSDELGARA